MNRENWVIENSRLVTWHMEGLFFWLDESGEHGLVAANSDQSNGIIWSDGLAMSGATAGLTANGVGGGIGGGETNTRLIVSKNPGGLTSAKLCSDEIIGIYGGWYLPSKGELHLMYTNLRLAGLGNFKDEFYWSSTEVTANSAWRQLFSNGFQIAGGKLNVNHVRAIRAF